MRKMVWAGSLIVLLVSVAFGDESQIRVDGVMESSNGPAAMINGRLFRVGDQVGDVVITDIDMEGIEVEQNGLSVRHEVKDAGGAAKLGASTVKTEKKKGWKSWFSFLRKDQKKKSLAKSLLRRKTESSAPDCLTVPNHAGELSLNQKMSWSSRLQRDQESTFRRFEATTLRRCNTPDEFFKAQKQYSKMNSGYVGQFNKLRLPCPQTMRDNGSYQRWSEKHQESSVRMMKHQMAELKSAARRCGVEFH